jgi:hypothetical protein
MAPERASKNLRAFNTQVHPAVLNCGNSGLRNTSEFGELTLAQLLKFAQDTDGLAD